MTTSSPPSAAKLGLLLGPTLAICGIGSILFAYGVFGRPDSAWELQFNKLGNEQQTSYGMWIEVLRLMLTVVGTLLVTCTRFGKELMLLLRVTDTSTWSLRLWTAASREAGMVTVARGCFVVMAIGLGAARTVWVLGPDEMGRASKLVQWGEDHAAYVDSSLTAAKKFESAQACYRAKLLYMLIFDCIILPVAVVLPLFAILSIDLPRLAEAQRKLMQEIAQGNPLAGVQTTFQCFRADLQEQAMRYLNVFAALSIVVAFEVWIGNRTIASEGRDVSNVAFAVVGANALFFVLLWYFYHDAWQKTARYAVEKGESDKQLREEYHPWSLLKTLLHESLSGYTVLLLLLSPFKDSLPFG